MEFNELIKARKSLRGLACVINGQGIMPSKVVREHAGIQVGARGQ